MNPPLTTVMGTATRDTRFFGHPRGLSTLFFVEMWERFSYYGIGGLVMGPLVSRPLQRMTAARAGT